MSVYCSVTKLCPTLFDPMDCSPPGFPRQEYWSGVTLPSPGDLPDPGIKPMSFMSPELASGFFTTSANWEVFWFPQFSSVQSLSRVQLFVTPWAVACQAPLSMGFSRQEHWSGLRFPSPGGLPDPGIKPTSPACIGRQVLYH